MIWNNLFVDQNDLRDSVFKREMALMHPDIKFGSPFPNLSHAFRRYRFPSLPGVLSELSHPKSRRQSPSPTSLIEAAFASWSTIGPFVPRLVKDGKLTQAMYTVALQRNRIDIGGNVGMLSIGELPEGVKKEELTWVPLRGYSRADGGIPGPPDSPTEVRVLFYQAG